MRVNVAVCGAWHLRHVVRYLHRADALGTFYYAHRFSTGERELGVPQEKLVNVWFKAYVGHAYERVFGTRFHVAGREVYDSIWDYGAALRWRDCDLLHLVLQGKFATTFQTARRHGAVVLGEALNSHPLTMKEILDDESERLGLRKPAAASGTDRQVTAYAPCCDHLLVPSAFVKRSFVEHGYDSARIDVVLPGVDQKRFHPSMDAENEYNTFRVLCVGQISPRKGQIYLLEAWRKLALPNAELVLIGGVDDTMRSVIERHADGFHHVARVDNKELYKYYGAASVFVLPSLEDAFAYVVAEALACGLPVITTVNTGASELLTEGRNGFVVPIRSVESIAEKLELLYREQALRKEMAAAALTSSRRMGWDGYAEQLRGLYERVLADHGGGAAGCGCGRRRIGSGPCADIR